MIMLKIDKKHIDSYVESVSWLGNEVVDYIRGNTFTIDFNWSDITEKTNNYWEMLLAFNFDAAINSSDGKYVFIYEKLGTKWLLFKDWEILREINRSYYHANSYEYPAAFTTIDWKTYLVHCPIEYSQIDLEDVETGEIVTNIKSRNSTDVFHSRFEVSPNGKYLLSKGWIWHPIDYVFVFDLEAWLKNPCLLDRGISIEDFPCEFNTACFKDDEIVLLGVFDEFNNWDIFKINSILAWDFKKNEIKSSVEIDKTIWNLFPIDDQYCWDLFNYPKIINFKTGEVIDYNEEIFTWNQTSSIIYHLEDKISYSYNRKLKAIAIKTKDKNLDVIFPNTRKK